MISVPKIKIAINNVTVEEIIEEVQSDVEIVNIDEITGFSPKKCISTLQDDTYRVIFEKKAQLSSDAGADGIDNIINAFPSDLIYGHSLCVEFSDVYNVLYVAIDSAPIDNEFYETFLTIEREVANEIETVILVRFFFYFGV